MSEGAKTLTFVAGALLLAGAAYVTQPKPEVVQLDQMVDTVLFAEFEDPNQASSLEIIRYDETLGDTHTFKVAKDGQSGVWSIPSHDNYPADAEEQMRDAALSLVGLKVLGIASQDAADHELYGVKEPDREGTKLGEKGVGLLISFRDSKDDELAELIVGKPVRSQEGQRFVRRPGQDAVYVVSIDPTKLSTDFKAWIKEDLLQLNAFDIESLRLKDYSVIETEAGPRLELRSDAVTNWNATDSKWLLEKLVTYRGQEEVPTELLPTEELNSDKLNEAKNGLADLEIVDVRRKPAGLGADLKANTAFMDNPENRRSLLSLGFYPGRAPDGSFELMSANGEIHALVRDGYEYVLRFGGVRASSDETDTGLNRYLFVTTRVVEDRFPMPSLEELPPEAPAAAAPAGGAAPAPAPQPPGAASTIAPPSSAETTNGGQTAGQSNGGSATSDESGTQESPARSSSDTTEQAPQPAAAPDAAAGAASQPAQPAQPAAAAQEGAPPSAEEEQQRKLNAERERIVKDNQRKMDEWREKKKTAEDKVRELNARFADWYYVISEDVYRKIHLSRNDIIRESAAAGDEGFGVDAFRKLQEQGVEGGQPSPSTGTPAPIVPPLN